MFDKGVDRRMMNDEWRESESESESESDKEFEEESAADEAHTMTADATSSFSDRRVVIVERVCHESSLTRGA